MIMENGSKIENNDYDEYAPIGNVRLYGVYEFDETLVYIVPIYFYLLIKFNYLKYKNQLIDIYKTLHSVNDKL
jgi:hypothetical protein